MSTKKRYDEKKKGMAPKPSPTNQRKFHGKSRRFRTGVTAAAFIGVAMIALGAIYVLHTLNGPSASKNQAGTYSFAVGNPGPGEQAPPIKLQSTDGSIFDLSAQRGKTVLLFFQEGLACQPCWDQIKDIESNMKQFQSLGIDTMVSITSDPLDALKQKVADEGLSTPILYDPNLAVSRTYDANKYGMMGESSDGHTFIVIGPDERIRWRADFGGAPNYTMYVPISTLIADMKEGLYGKA